MQTIDITLLLTQGLTRSGFERQVCLRMVVLHALITFVEQAGNLTREIMAVGFVQRQIVYPVWGEGRCQ